jgi:hypothetical protein
MYLMCLTLENPETDAILWLKSRLPSTIESVKEGSGLMEHPRISPRLAPVKVICDLAILVGRHPADKETGRSSTCPFM